MSQDFYDKNAHALRPVDVVTRDSLGTLAVQIVAAKHDLKSEDPDRLIRALFDEITVLHQNFDTGLL